MPVLSLRKWNEGDVTGTLEFIHNGVSAHGDEQEVRKQIAKYLKEYAEQVLNGSIPVEYYREPKFGTNEADWVKIDRDEYVR